jgi:hypothetical protein
MRPLGEIVMNRRDFVTLLFTILFCPLSRKRQAPRVAPVRNLRVPDLEARLMGETVFSSRTPADRAAELIAEDAIFCDEAISRREEWMCYETLINGREV